ncbi:helix-turn-helix domain-containing protein [Rhodococcus sp. ZPP]|uniref:PucR family transcriptional regulator n=1 Tax=Rhodococcus sp. ZPP TaxID=2749906 RepID=UPI001FCC53DD|nr:helix-turn-helix domain-containing protein [Rhodococcus sp. ZPP]
MTAQLPTTPLYLRVLEGLLAHTAAQAGFADACVLVEDGARGMFVPLSHSGSRPSGLRVLPDDALIRRALASTEPIHAAGWTLSGSCLRERDSGRVVLLRLSASSSAPIRLLFLSDPRREGDFTLRHSAALTSFRSLVDSAAAAVLDAEEQRRRRRDLEHGKLLADERGAVVERLDDAVATADTMSAIVRVCAELTGKAVVLFDRRQRRIAAAGPNSAGRISMPSLETILRSYPPDATAGPRPVVLAAGPTTDLARRKIVTPIVERGEHFGWLVIDEHPTPLRPTDEYTAARSARRIGAQFLIQRRIARVAWNAKSALTRQLVRGTGAQEDLAASGEYLGVNTEARRVLVFVQVPDGESEDLDHALVEHLERSLGVEVLSTRGSEGLLLLVEASDDVGSVVAVSRVKTAITQAAAAVSQPTGLIAGVSSVCEPAAFSRAYREAREVVRCVDRFTEPTAHRILAVDDLGPVRVFLANGDVAALRRFVGDVLGPILGDAPGSADLLRTLQCWFDAGRSPRGAATHLGVHENTVRLRLSRVHAMTGLDVVGNAADQLSIQTALLVLRFQGHPALVVPGRMAAGEVDLHASARGLTTDSQPHTRSDSVGATGAAMPA